MIVYACYQVIKGEPWGIEFYARAPQAIFTGDGWIFEGSESNKRLFYMWNFEKLFPRLVRPGGISKFEILEQENGDYIVRRL